MNKTLDVRHLPDVTFSSRSLLWWGGIIGICIEATAFALCVVSYFYVRSRYTEAVWPPMSTGHAAMLAASVGTVLLIASALPMQWANRACKSGDLRSMRWGYILATLLAFGFLACRGLEMHYLPFRWDSNAHGSLFWLLVGLHTTEAAAGVIDSLMLIAVFFTGPVEHKHRMDGHVGAVFWYFLVLVWIPVYAILYLEGQVLR